MSGSSRPSTTTIVRLGCIQSPEVPRCTSHSRRERRAHHWGLRTRHRCCNDEWQLYSDLTLRLRVQVSAWCRALQTPPGGLCFCRRTYRQVHARRGSSTLRLAPRGYCSAGIGSLTGYVVISATTTPSMMPVANVAVAATTVVRVIQEKRRVAVIFRVPSVTFARYRVGNFAPLSVLN